MTEDEYIAVSNLQRMRAASRLLRDCLPFEDEAVAGAIDVIGENISALEKRVNEMCE